MGVDMNNVTGMISRQVADAKLATSPTRIPVKPEYINGAGLSDAAKTALLSAGTNRQGATCAPLTPAEALIELQVMGYLGEGWGLTRRGTIKRQILAEDEMDRLFN